MRLKHDLGEGAWIAAIVSGIGSFVTAGASIGGLYRLDPSQPQQWISVGLGLCLSGVLAWAAKITVVEP